MSTKRKRGGKIRKNGINDTVPFKFIQSIGYELETTQLAKFTRLPKDTDEYRKLMHTDLGTNYLDILHGKDPRKRELMELPTKPGDKFTFLVTNDKAETEFTRHLKKICESEREKAKSDGEEGEDDDAIRAEEYDGDAFYHANHFKNSLYIFRPFQKIDHDIQQIKHPNKQIDHHIQFEFNETHHCGFFSDVEWVGTFYTPERGPDIIMDTFAQILERLFQHLDALEPTLGNLIVHFSSSDEVIVDEPIDRKLFNLKGTSLYYLQTTYGESKMETLDDLRLKPQMTFSCPVDKLIEVLNAMIQPVSHTNFASNALNYQTEFIKTLGTIVKELCDTEISPGFNMKDWEHLATFKGYLWLFLFKIFRYYSYFIKQKDKQAELFKNTLFFNSRHGNAQLYEVMKKLLAKHPGINGDPAETLQKIILQPNILKKIFLGTYILRQIFLITKLPGAERAEAEITDIFEFNKKGLEDLTQDDPHYGDPSYSLKSYLQFFENPQTPNDSSSDSERPIRGAIKLNMNDWFRYSETDKFCSLMEIKDHLVLVEVRCFLELIVDTFFGILFPKGHDKHVPSLTIGQLKDCVENYRHTHTPPPRPASAPLPRPLTKMASAPPLPKMAWAPNESKPSRRTRKMQKFSKILKN